MRGSARIIRTTKVYLAVILLALVPILLLPAFGVSSWSSIGIALAGGVAVLASFRTAGLNKEIAEIQYAIDLKNEGQPTTQKNRIKHRQELAALYAEKCDRASDVVLMQAVAATAAFVLLIGPYFK